MDFFNQLRQVIAEWSLIRKMSVLIVVGIALAVIGLFVHLSNQAAMEPLFTNLNSDDMGTILSRLDQQGVSYEVDSNKKTILVPSTQVLALRMQLAEDGLPQFGGVGFELFDKGGFGRSDFEQRVNFQRALEGELTRTISRINEVESSRVHLVLPERSLFAETHQSASASVILKLGTRGATLSRSTVYAITHLVASAVEGLDSSKVTVVDSDGRLLTAAGGDPALQAGGNAYGLKMQIEKSIEQRILGLLSPVIGLGKVIARVTAEINFTREESEEEIVDPSNSAVVTESRSNAEDKGTGVEAASVGGRKEGSEQLTYEVSKSLRRRVTPMGTIKNLSVAILVDGTYADNENGEATYAPRPPEELERLSALVKGAIGFSDERGDTLQIDNLAFLTPEANMIESEAWYAQKNTYGFLLRVISYVLILITIFAVFLFVIRPMMRGLQSKQTTLLGNEGDPAQLEGGGSAELGQYVLANPDGAAKTLRKWLE